MFKTNTPSVESILNTVTDAIIAIDEKGVIRSVNPAVEKIFGYIPKELIGKNVSVLMPNPYAREHNGYIKKYLQTGKGKIIGTGREVVAKKKDGTVFPVYLGVSEGRQEGSRHFFTGVIRDVTEIRRYQDDLKRQSEFTAAVLNTVRSLVLVLDRRGCIVNFNRACEETTGYLFQEVAGKPFWNFFLSTNDRDAVIKNFMNINSKQLVNNFEAVWLTKNGQARLITWSNSLLLDKKNSLEYVIGTGIDITERRKLERLVTDIARSERQRLGQELHDGIAQDLASTAIMAKILEKKLVRQSAPEAQQLKRLVHQINRAVSQTRELAQGLYATKIHSENIASSLRKLVHNTEKTTGIHCMLRIDSNVHLSDDEVAANLYRIAREAVGNAVKHGHAKNICIQLKKKSDHQSELRIENDGKKFLKPLKQKGLGLYIMQSRAAMLGALINISPGSRGGAVVSCVFPILS